MSWLGQIFHNGCERTTTVERAVTGLVMGALVGAGLVTVFSIFVLGPLAIFAGILSFFVWGFGLFAIATPGWWVLYRLGARCQTAAVIYGGGLSFLTVGAWVWIPGLIYGADFSVMTKILPFAGVMGLAGAIVGWVVAKVAYEPALIAA